MSEESNRRGLVGLFGGTFDPIHFGHINLAIELLEKCRLTEVVWCPASISPLRTQSPPIGAAHRLAMLRLALEEIPAFSILDSEIERNGPSYSIDTVKNILKTEERKLVLLLGEDALLDFHRWKDVEELVTLVPIYIACRRGANLMERLQELPLSELVKEAIRKGIIETTLMEVSATRIRQRIKKGLYCGHLVPAKVLDYIYANQLYF